MAFLENPLFVHFPACPSVHQIKDYCRKRYKKGIFWKSPHVKFWNVMLFFASNIIKCSNIFFLHIKIDSRRRDQGAFFRFPTSKSQSYGFFLIDRNITKKIPLFRKNSIFETWYFFLRQILLNLQIFFLKYQKWFQTARSTSIF